MKKLLLIISLLATVLLHAQDIFKDDIYYYDLAKNELEKRGLPNSNINENISKAIELNPSQNEYRWIRVRCNMMSNSSEQNLFQAISDIKYIISSGDKTSKLYKALGVAYNELGDKTYRFKKAKENGGYSDDNSNYINEQNKIYDEAIIYYENAIESYKKAVELNTELNINYEINRCIEKIEQINDDKIKLK